MKKLIILITILLIPISAFSTDWNHKGQFGEINKYLKCLDSNNCFSIHSVTSVLYVYHSSNQGKD